MTKFLNTVSGPKVDVSDIIVTPVIKNADVVPQPEATPSSIDMGELNSGSAIVISSPTSITLDAINVSASSEYTPTLNKDLVTKDYTDLLSNALAELDNEKQTSLISGTNIKTINDTSLLGSGDITISDEKVKYDVEDTTAGYVVDKIVAGTGISVAEGSGANENKLVITNDNPTPYTLPTASTEVVGGVKVDGTSILIDESGVISAALGDSLDKITLGNYTLEYNEITDSLDIIYL